MLKLKTSRGAKQRQHNANKNVVMWCSGLDAEVECGGKKAKESLPLRMARAINRGDDLSLESLCSWEEVPEATGALYNPSHLSPDGGCYSQIANA